jgi:hypothetical protein
VSKSSSHHRRKRLRVPGWYYILLVTIGLFGTILIMMGSQPVKIDPAELPSRGDYVLGDTNAPVTIVEWASFQ